MAILRKLIEDAPGVVPFRDNLALCHARIGLLQRQAGHLAEAKASFQEATSIRRKLAEDNPTNAHHQANLALLLGLLGRARVMDGDVPGGIGEIREAIVILGRHQEGFASIYNISCMHAILAGIGDLPDSGISGDEREAEALAAVSTLRRAVEYGFRASASIRTDPDLDPLRSRPDFRLLMMDLTFPDRPFTGGASGK